MRFLSPTISRWMLASMAAAMLGGCGSVFFSSTQTGTLVPGPAATIADVPVPAGFKYEPDGSYSNVIVETKYREAVQNYYGKAALLRIAEFYQDQLPKNRWTVPNVEQQPNRIVITSTKPGETLTVTAWDETFYTYININLAPVKK